MDTLIDPIDSRPLPTPDEDQDNKPAKAIKVFSYACKIAYSEEAAHFEHQLTLTHRHRNLLTETLLKGREKYREIIKEHLGLASDLDNPTLQPELEKWRKQHFHLLRYKKGLQGKLMRGRREIYRKFVFDLAKKYSICGIEDFDLRQVTTKDPTKDQAHKLVKCQRTAAGISSLRLMLSQRLIIQKLSAENTTQKCHNCGSLEKWDAAHNVWHRCKQCNSRWDQDHNSVRNLLDLLCEIRA